MKIVQTLWSKPAEQSSEQVFDRLRGGWLDKRYHLISWAMSCLSCRRFYDEVELVTDAAGQALLIDLLDLPYTSIRCELDQLNHYHPSLWAMGKLYAYGIQDQPFLHIDSDVYLWARFRSEIEQAGLAVQNVEINHSYYRQVLEQLNERIALPQWMIAPLQADDLYSINAGILGGHDLEFIQNYVQQARGLIDKHQAAIVGVDNPGLTNTIFEQYLFYQLAQREGRPIVCYYPDPDPGDYSYLAHLYAVPQRSQYVHLIGKGNKTSPLLLEQLEERLRQEFPDYYYKIEALLADQLV